ncbi:sugar phosphate isomerase/epimerase family protein [Saccharopolyspora mangrovi]|uniref:Sugar phosphate isomerase/epimerase n=1 Tax=Saccharopolyspora mangrovi TaxID=3082379 RepID=A0ABU6AIF0_9PSEU|nr:sugar phosphate isomerase/epimerase [Saccharopolyspora sp. S2-29]MEB3371268.1 sugar phosphate isomerase/epimerase [Saccharopolyspora sp. S2-29]
MTDNELIAACWVTAGAARPMEHDDRSPLGVRERIEAAAKAGFKGFGIGYSDLLEAEKTVGYKGLRSALDDNGIKYFEIEMLEDWFVTDERRAEADTKRANMLRAAEAVGARHIKVGGDFTGGPFEPDHMAEEFHALATDAANAGTRVVFEPMPFVNVKTPQQALEFVQAANHPAGGILIDIWHVVRAGVDIASLSEIPGEYIHHIELDDAPLNFAGDVIADTFNGRTFCGEGEFDVAGFVEAIKKTGFRGPWGVELLGAEYRQLPLEEAVPKAYRTTMEFLEG